jgi:hypothetical protein
MKDFNDILTPELYIGKNVAFSTTTAVVYASHECVNELIEQCKALGLGINDFVIHKFT